MANKLVLGLGTLLSAKMMAKTTMTKDIPLSAVLTMVLMNMRNKTLYSAVITQQMPFNYRYILQRYIKTNKKMMVQVNSLSYSVDHFDELVYQKGL